LKRPTSILGIVLILIGAVALAGFVVSPALGGPGFLTRQQARKLFVGKGQAQAFLRKREAPGCCAAPTPTPASTRAPKPMRGSCPQKA
jgi:hypothetical protein